MSRFFVRVAKTKVVEVDSLLAAGAAVRDEIEGPLNWIGSREWTLKIAGRRDGAIVYKAIEERGNAAALEQYRKAALILPLVKTDRNVLPTML